MPTGGDWLPVATSWTQPCSQRSRRRGSLVTLANVNGRMARYKVLMHRKTGAEYIRFLD